MNTLRRHLWMGALVLGLLLVGMGTFFVVLGFEAKDTIRAALADEGVTTSADAVEFGVPGGVLVADAKTAEAQANVIKMHSINRYGRYTEMDRDDPNRDAYINGLTLRNSLNLAVLGFGVASLAIGTGAIIIVLGVGTAALGVPLLYGIAKEEPELAVNSGARAAPLAPAM